MTSEDHSSQMFRNGRGNTEENNETDSENERRVPTPRRNKFYTKSPPPDFNNPWAHSSQWSHAPPVNFWYPDNRQVQYDRYAPVGNYPPPPIAHGGYAPIGNYPPPPVAHGGYAAFPPPPPRTHSNPFSVGNLPQQPIVQEEVAGPSHEQPHHPSSGKSPAPRNTVPIYDL